MSPEPPTPPVAQQIIALASRVEGRGRDGQNEPQAPGVGGHACRKWYVRRLRCLRTRREAWAREKGDLAIQAVARLGVTAVPAGSCRQRSPQTCLRGAQLPRGVCGGNDWRRCPRKGHDTNACAKFHRKPCSERPRATARPRISLIPAPHSALRTRGHLRPALAFNGLPPPLLGGGCDVGGEIDHDGHAPAPQHERGAARRARRPTRRRARVPGRRRRIVSQRPRRRRNQLRTGQQSEGGGGGGGGGGGMCLCARSAHMRAAASDSHLRDGGGVGGVLPVHRGQAAVHDQHIPAPRKHTRTHARHTSALCPVTQHTAARRSTPSLPPPPPPPSTHWLARSTTAASTAGLMGAMRR
jgi:hypothetical protein